MNPRLFVEVPPEIGSILTVGGEDGHHFARVLRVRPGEPVAVSYNGCGYLCAVEQVDASSAELTLRVQEPLPSHEPEVCIYLAQALPKGDKVDDIVQHGTEVGLSGVLLFPGKRSITRFDEKKSKQKAIRWQRIVREAAGQSQRDKIPDVTYVGTDRAVADWLSRVAPAAILFLDEEEHVRSMREVLEGVSLSSRAENQPHAKVPALAPKTDATLSPAVVVCVGPEGGWDETERAWWREHGAEPITLGHRILRTETAGLVATTAILYHFRSLGG